MAGVAAAAACTEPPPPKVPGPAEPPSATASASAPSPDPTTPDEEFRRRPPAAGADVVFNPPKIDEAKLSNGIRVLLVERHDLPIVALQIVTDRGGEASAPGVASFAAAMLAQGTKKRTALQISDTFEALGAEYGTSADYDGVYLWGKVLSSQLTGLTEVLADLLQNPTFPKDEVERERSKRQTSLAQELDSPGRLLGRTLSEVLYPPRHPYATPLLGSEASLKTVSSLDLSTFHRQHVQPNHLTITVAGDVTKAALLELLEKQLGSWKGTAPAVPAPPGNDKLAKEPRVIIVDKAGSSQSNVSVASVGVARSNPDFEALLVLNSILGGKFTSRLNLRLREELGITYGARSGFDMRHGPGPFSAGAAIKTNKTDEGVKEIFAAIEKIRKEQVTDEELHESKTSMIKALPARFESVNETASTLTALAIYGLPLDEFANRAAKISKVTREDVLRVAQKYLVPDNMRVVIVGDAAKIKPGLEALKLGQVEVRQPPASKSATTAPAAGPKTQKAPAPVVPAAPKKP